jgi:hypothetical protein
MRNSRQLSKRDSGIRLESSVRDLLMEQHGEKDKKHNPTAPNRLASARACRASISRLPCNAPLTFD